MTSTESDSVTTQRSKGSTSESENDAYVSQTIDFLSTVFARYPRDDFAFRLWEGTQWRKPGVDINTPIAFSIQLNHPGSLRRMFLPPSDVRLAHSYTVGEFDFHGDGSRMLDLGKHLWESWSWSDTLLSAYKLLRLPSTTLAPPPDDQASIGLQSSDKIAAAGSFHSKSRDKLAVQAHYDISNDFYQLWLDQRMVYSCAYFKSPHDDIDTAQKNKLDICCKKMRLKKGQRLLDVGCGWGAFVIHAAKYYGVTALGITLSEEQAQFGRQRVKEHNLQNVVNIVLRDYRDVHVDEDGMFDAVVSVGMIEHIGRDNLGEYFRRVESVLKPGGVFLNHGITLLHDEFKAQWRVRQGFFAKYIFPDGDVQPFPYVISAAVNSTRLEIRDVECLREHYALTLKSWYHRFLIKENDIIQMVGIQTFRLWRLYLLAAAWGFSNGLHSIYQTVFFKASHHHSNTTTLLPLTRDDWYTSS